MYLIFDYDGTLHDTAWIYWQGINGSLKTLSNEGFIKPKEITIEEAAGWLGYPSGDAWESMVPGLPKEIKERTIRETGKRMDLLIREGKSQLYPGVIELLERLKSDGHHLFILSNCTESYMESHKEAFKLERFIEGFYPAESYGYKPKTEIFKTIYEYCNEQYGPVNIEEFAVIGDRFHDIEAGIINGAHSVGCLYGSGTINELKDAEWKIQSPSGLLPIVEAGFR